MNIFFLREAVQSFFIFFKHKKSLARANDFFMERVAGIEPASQPWKGRIKATILYPRIWLLVG